MRVNRSDESSYEAAHAAHTASELNYEQIGETGESTVGSRSKKKTAIDSDASANLLKMSKKDLLEIMAAQGREIDELRAKVAELEEKLNSREIMFSKVGSLAEASLAVTDIFKEAEKAAVIYLENIRRTYHEK